MIINCLQKGFSLVEVLIAITVFAVGGLAAASMVTGAFNSIELANTYTDLTNVAAGRLEEFMAASIDRLKDLDGDGAAGLGDTGVQADGRESTARYLLSWNFAEGVPVANATTIRVICAAHNAGHGGIRRTVELTAVNYIP